MNKLINKLIIEKSLHNFNNKNLDSKQFLANYLYGTKVIQEKELTKEDIENLRDLNNLGILFLHHQANNKLVIFPTKLGFKCLTFIKNQLSIFKKHIQRNYLIFIFISFFTLFFTILSLVFLGIFCYILAGISAFLTFIGVCGIISFKLNSIPVINPRLIKNHQIQPCPHLDESNYLKLINKYANSKQQRLFKKELSRINKKELQ